MGHQPRSEQEKNIACSLFRILRWRCFSRRWVNWSKDQCQLYTYILIRSWFADFLLRSLTILWNFDEELSCKVLQFIPSLGAHCQILLWRMIFGGEKNDRSGKDGVIGKKELSINQFFPRRDQAIQSKKMLNLS